LKKIVVIFIIIVAVLAGGVFLFMKLTEERPFRDLSASDILEVTLYANYYGTVLTLSDNQVNELAQILRKVVVYDRVHSERLVTAGGGMTFHLTKTIGGIITVSGFGSDIIIINGVGYRAKEKPLGGLNRMTASLEWEPPVTHPIAPKYNNLLRTSEFLTTERMEELMDLALSWQSSVAGMGAFAKVVAIEPSDGSNQQVFISIGWDQDGAVYERMQIQAPDGVQARILFAGAGAGSGELNIGYRFTTTDSEWVELFSAFTFDLEDGSEPWHWRNVTEWAYDLDHRLHDRQFE